MEDVYIKIKPSDTVFFRDGFTFKIGLNNYLQSLDIPYPSVFYGAIFSAILRQDGFNDIKYKIKKGQIGDELAKILKIDDVYIYDEEENEIFTHAPLDIFYNDYIKKIGDYDIENKTFNSPKNEIDKFKRAEDDFISVHDLIENYYENNMNDIDLYSKKKFFGKYLKTGIAVDGNSKTSKDKCMYRIDMTQFCDSKFSYLLRCKIDTKRISLKNDIIRLGGESKLASFTHTLKELKVTKEIEYFYKNTVIEENKIKVILTSPMIINDYCKFLKDNNIKIAVTGKPNYIGGYDMAAKHKKAMKKAVPSGSVFVIENNSFINKEIRDIKLEFIESAEQWQRVRGFGSVIIMPFRGVKK